MATATLPTANARLSPHRWTVAEFNRMGDMGWFEGKRAFLLDGVIVEQGPMDPPHATVLGLVQQAMQAVFASGWWVRSQSPLHIDDYNDPLPDIAVVTGSPRDYAGVHPTTAALVIEVADSTLATDLTEKAERYATAKVAEYWVVDIQGRQLYVLRDPRDLAAGLDASAYGSQTVFAATDRVSPLCAPQASVAVADLLI